MLLPSLDWIETEKEQCEMCGLWFPGGIPWEDKDAHYLRCIERKVDEAKWRQARGQVQTSKGWRYADGSLAL